MPYGTRFSYILSKKTKKEKGGNIAGLFPQEGHKGFRCVRPSNLLAIACSSSYIKSMHNDPFLFSTKINCENSQA